MTPHDIELVQASFTGVLPRGQMVAELFYERVFAMAPDVRTLFRGNLAAQAAKLFAALELVVAALDRLEPLLPVIDGLAVRHRAYGVVDRHYYVVGEALLWTLERACGAAWTPAHRNAWLQAYGVLSTRMMLATRRPEA